MTLETMLNLEPELAEIARHSEGDNPWQEYAKAKSEATGLVGFGARNKDLSTPEAYETFTRHLCEVLGI